MKKNNDVKIISSFDGQYAFLSNFYHFPVTFEGITYPTNEHLFQAMKVLDSSERRKIAACSTPSQAKKVGRKVDLRENWNSIRLDMMKMCLKLKFSDDYLKEKLLSTGDAILQEGNSWNDTFWGVCNGVGENHLGKLIMEVREELKN